MSQFFVNLKKHTPLFIKVFFRKVLSLFQDLYYRKLLNENLRYKNKYLGESCFILGNSPSLKDYKLENLSGMKVFSVSRGYLEKNFNTYQPLFHCIANLTYTNITNGFTKEKAINWFKEIDFKINNAEVILDLKEYNLVVKNNLFPKRNLIWMKTGQTFSNKLDITKTIPGQMTVIQNAIIAAAYMGFKKVYLLGVDLDFYETKSYKHFYDSSNLSHQDPSLKPGSDKYAYSRAKILAEASELMYSFERLKDNLKDLNVDIYNCSKSSKLDMFGYIDFEKVLLNNNLK